MKRLQWLSLLLTLSLLCVLLSGCTAVVKQDPLKTLRNARFVTASDGELLFTMEWSETNGVYRFSSPELLQPLTVTVTDQKILASYRELETEVTDEFCANILPLYRAMHAFRSSEAERGGQGERSYLRTTLDEDTFLMYYDPDSGVFTRLEWTGADGPGGLDIISCTESNSE